MLLFIIKLCRDTNLWGLFFKDKVDKKEDKVTKCNQWYTMLIKITFLTLHMTSPFLVIYGRPVGEMHRIYKIRAGKYSLQLQQM